LYEGQFNMAVSTTQSIWRSGGGDQTRTAYCGTGVMAANFYVADVSAASANVVVSSTNSSPVILPAGAVVMSITITVDNATGTIDMGHTLYTTGTSSTNSLANELTDTINQIVPGSATAGTSLGTVISSSEMIYITAGVGASAGTGSVNGVIQYFVTDPLGGQQNV
jgi:hypothetical protein